MAGTYWLTVLPDPSKLKSAIDASMRGVKIKADFGVDKQQAQKAGQEAARTAEQAASKSKPKVKPEADKPASKKAGKEAADEAGREADKNRPKVKPQADAVHRAMTKVRDIEQTLREIRAWNFANPKRRKTKSGVMRHVTAWMAKEQNAR
jgi:hypothetical protein